MSEEVYKCEDCGLHYRKKELAETCERDCKEKGMCNSEITAQSIERENK
jgi:hypothetical protein